MKLGQDLVAIEERGARQPLLPAVIAKEFGMFWNHKLHRSTNWRSFGQVGQYQHMKSASSVPQELRTLDTHQVARITGLSESTLRKWRVAGVGPNFLKLGRTVRYHPAHVERWMLDNMCVNPTARSGQERTHGTV